MYITVRLLNGFKEPLTYEIPDNWNAKQLEGTLIKVPLQKRYEFALVEKSFAKLDGPVSYTIRQATQKDLIPTDPTYLPFLKKLCSYYTLETITLLRRLKSFLKEKERTQLAMSTDLFDEGNQIVLTDEQQKIVASITPEITKGRYFPGLIHGVTGSGKTEIYKQLIIHAWKEGKGALLLFPEVSLAIQFARLLKEQLPKEIDLFSFHSATGIKEKRALWHTLMDSKPAVILGVHLPMLLPLPHLGIIIIDEEHDTGYQEKRHPKIHTKEAALLRAQSASIPIIAGSATPSISSLYNCIHKGWHLFELKNRFSGAFPSVSVVKLTNKSPRRHFFVSTELEEALKQQLIKKEQTIIFLNRRGYSFFIQCKSCGDVPQCINCDVSLTLHSENILRCHYCSFETKIADKCHNCSKKIFLKKGIGTQQVVTILEKIFPQARIGRADLDTTVNKKRWTQTLADFEAGNLDILVGTQTITKGYHFPRVTLVGILWADSNVNIPMYNAAEVTLQQLIQVAGRAGRQSKSSRVIVQTLLDHPLFSYLNEQKYRSFFDHEIEKRALVGYPPCTRLAEIELKHTDEAITIRESEQFCQALTAAAERLKKKLIILGPSQPPVSRIKKTYSRKIYLKASQIGDIIDAYRSLSQKGYRCAISFTPNPLS